MEKRTLLRLHAFGHAYSPWALEHDLVEPRDIDKLNGDESVVKGWVRSYQSWMAHQINVRAYMPAASGGLERTIHIDGEIGPFTEHEILFGERCGFPDYPHPERGYVTFDVDCPEAGETKLGGAEEANWPDACRRELTASYNMSLPGLTDQQLLELTLEGSKHWMEHFHLKIVQKNSDYPNTNRYSFRANLGGSVLADQFLATNRCGVRLRGRYDNRNWSPVLYVTTHTHEEGHFWGCPHSNYASATMYPSITNTSMSRRGALHAADKAIMRSLGYKERTEPLPPDKPDPPGPTPPTDQPVIEGVLRIRGTDHEYVVTPKARV